MVDSSYSKAYTVNRGVNLGALGKGVLCMNAATDRLPDYECIHLDNDQLELSFVQVKYPSIPRFSDESFLAAIKESFLEEYPLLDTSKLMNMVISPQGISQAPGNSLLSFSTFDRRWTIDLTDDTVALKTQDYGDIKELTDRFTWILEQVGQHLRPRHQLRFGLRYINELRHPNAKTYEDWRELLNPELLGLAARGVLGGKVEQTIGEVRLDRGDGTFLLRHGFLSGTTVMAQPQGTRVPKSGPFYLLDLDYYDEKPHSFDAHAPGKQMSQYNQYLYRVFRWAIGDGDLFTFLRGS